MRFVVFIIALVINFTILASIQTKVTAKSALLLNAKTGQILFEKNKEVRRPPASLTKIATCLVALDKISNFDEKITCKASCLQKMSKRKKIEQSYKIEPYLLEPDAASFGIYTNEVLTIRDLLYAMFLPSANDAANVLAYHLSDGDIMGYMEEVNEYLKAIGCKDSVFYNPHGLHYPKHLSTVTDLAILAKEALKDPRIAEIASTVSYQRPKTNKQPSRTVWNLNKLLRRGQFNYPKAKGLKTGNHENAGYCYIGFAEDENRSLLCVLLGCKTADIAFREARKLFDLAFGEKLITRQLFNAEEVTYSRKISKSKSLLKATIKKDVFINFYPSEELKIKPQLVWYNNSLPIKKGDKVGHILILSEDEKHFFQAEPLYALESVEKSKPIIFKLFILFSISAALLVVIIQIYKKSYRSV